MDKKGLRNSIAEKTGIPPELVESVLEAFRETVTQLLIQGGQLHWGGFIRAWTVMKRPVDKVAQPLFPDSKECKIRYRKPDCNFVTSMGKDMKGVYYNIAAKGWEKKPLPVAQAEEPSKEVRYIEIT